ncbi:MAG: glycine cleavage system protein GcvH [Candidatus Jordarchaeales archaeon]|nr:glycine cleavage system protein GcvH [Candidatus Jordarchaeia archaeon]
MVKVDDVQIPDDLLYNETHQWAKIENGRVRVGITDFAQKQLKEIVYVELPEVGDEVSQGDEFGTIESVKAVSELYAPVSGTIVEVNEALEDSPELINSDPYGEGWMVVIEASNIEEEKENLLSADNYAEIVEKELEK